MANIDKQTAQACGISESELPYLQKIDEEKTETGTLVMIRVIPGGHSRWLKDQESKKDSVPDVCPLDRFDSGVIYFIQTDEKSGEMKAIVVCMSDPRPGVHAVTQNTASLYISARFSESPNSKFRLWLEGAILRMVTLSDGRTFIASRARIRCGKSKWITDPQCPSVEEVLNQAAVLQGVRLSKLEIPGTCHVFLLRDKYNQIFNGDLEKPELYHLCTYEFGKGNYVQVKEEKYSLEGFRRLPSLSKEEACEAVLKGGVILREKSNGVTDKFMLETTAEVYDWMTKDPCEVAFSLLSKRPLELFRFRGYLKGESLAKVNSAIENMVENEIFAAKYVIKRNMQTLKKGFKVHPKLEYKGIDNAIGYLRYKYAEEREKAIASGRFNPNPKKSKNGKKPIKPTFHLGRTKEATEERSISIVRDYFISMREKNPVSYYRLIRKCARFAKQEEFYARKARGELKKDEEEPEDSDDDIFIPLQIDCSDLPDIPSKWGDQ